MGATGAVAAWATWGLPVLAPICATMDENHAWLCGALVRYTCAGLTATAATAMALATATLCSTICAGACALGARLAGTDFALVAMIYLLVGDRPGGAGPL